MSDASSAEIFKSAENFIASHLQAYLRSGGAEGHIMDTTHAGGLPFGTHCLIRYKGRKSGKTFIVPLCYGDIGGEVAIIGSKGGADRHPEWYLNLVSAPEIDFQIATQAYRCTIREPEGDERRKIWDFMIQVYPPYIDYQAATARVLPIVLLKPVETIDLLTMPDAG